MLNQRIILSSFAFLFFAFSAVADVRPASGPVYVSHRGANREADENTLEAYSIAADYGMDFIECDPRMSADGVFVIMHDATVDRTTDGRGKVKDMTLAEIKSIRTERGSHVPTLEEVLALASERNMGVYLDIKTYTFSDLDDMIRLLDQYGMSDKVIMGFYKKGGAKYVEGIRPEIVTNVAWPLAVLTLGQARRIGADYIGTIYKLGTKRVVKKAHRLDLKIITMPVNDLEKIERQRRIGMDAIQTDLPQLVRGEQGG